MCARRPLRMRGRGRCLVASYWAVRPRAACVLRARGFGSSLFIFSSLVTAVLWTRGCSEPCVVLSLNMGGSGEALGLDILSAWFCAWIRHDRLTAAKHTSYEHRLSDAHASQSLSPSKRTILHANKANMAATLNQQAMEHAMASRPAITDPVAPSVGPRALGHASAHPELVLPRSRPVVEHGREALYRHIVQGLPERVVSSERGVLGVGQVISGIVAHRKALGNGYCFSWLGRRRWWSYRRLLWELQVLLDRPRLSDEASGRGLSLRVLYSCSVLASLLRLFQLF